MGYEEGRRLIDEADPLLLVIGLPVIPITLILAKLIKWEDFILRVWRQKAAHLPRPLSYIIDRPPLKPRADCDQILQDPGFNDPLGCTRMICGALLVPTVSSLVGKIFFSRFSGSQWRRSLIGGLAFILLKGALKIYLRKSQYIRYSQRSVRNYVPLVKSGQSSMSSRDDVGDMLPSSSSGELSGHETADEIGDDESEDEAPIPRPRTMFSMTISLGR